MTLQEFVVYIQDQVNLFAEECGDMNEVQHIEDWIDTFEEFLDR